jgi:hypothetical protein
MSVFYCEYHGKLEDADYVCCEEHPSGSGMVCADGLAEIEEEIEEEREEAKKPNLNRAFSPAQQAFINKCEAEADEDM